MNVTRAIVAAALLTGLAPVAAILKELERPPTPFFTLFGRLMARLLKELFGAGLAFATWGLPRQAVMPQTAVIIIC